MIKNKWLVNFCLGFVKLTGILPAWILLKPKVRLARGANRRLPRSCILVSNHMSLMDFVLYTLVFPFRTIRFLIAEVMFRGFLKPFLKLIGGIRVDRDAKSFDFVSHSLEVLDDGGIIGVFPQARLPVKGVKFPFTVSTAFIAIHSDAPIIPVYTDGKYGITKRTGVVIGAPICLKDYALEGLTEQEQIAHLTKVLEEKVYALKEELN
jgi:1-acyl-sn-glycerol-3-phosphate acyltransferase